MDLLDINVDQMKDEQTTAGPLDLLLDINDNKREGNYCYDGGCLTFSPLAIASRAAKPFENSCEIAQSYRRRQCIK
jgi:hypothetical protein